MFHEVSRGSMGRALRFGTVIGSGALFCAPTTHATTIYATGFEAPVFTAGQLIAGQDGWTSRFGSPTGTVSTNNPHSGLQDLELRFDQLPIFGFGFNLDTVRPLLAYDVVGNGTPVVNLSVQARLDGPLLGLDVVEAIFSAIDSDFNSFGEMQISADGHLYVYGSRFVDALVADVTLGVYHTLAMSIDFVNRATSFSIDGTSLVTFAFDDALQSTIFQAGSLHAAAPTDPALADAAQYTAYFDNYSITAVPEPGMWSSLLLGIALIASRAHRRETRDVP